VRSASTKLQIAAVETPVDGGHHEQRDLVEVLAQVEDGVGDLALAVLHFVRDRGALGALLRRAGDVVVHRGAVDVGHRRARGRVVDEHPVPHLLVGTVRCLERDAEAVLHLGALDPSRQVESLADGASGREDLPCVHAVDAQRFRVPVS